MSLTTFAVDDTQSSLTLSGGVGPFPLVQQAPGSLVTAYTGNLQADVDFANGAITFIKGGDGILAENSGNWQPLADGSTGAEPANYGGKITFPLTAVVAVRNIDLEPFSASLPLTPLGDGVSYGYPNSQQIKTHSGRAAYNYGSPQGGTKGFKRLPAAANQADSKGNASYLYDFNGDGSALELYLSVDISITATIHRFPITLNLDGVIVATGSLGVVGPATSHAAKSHDAALGTALVAGAHAHDQALVSNPFDNLDDSRAPGLQPTTLAHAAMAAPSAGFGSAHSGAGHQAAVDLLDAAFAELNPIEHRMI